MAQKKSQTATRTIELRVEMLKTPGKSVSNACAWARGVMSGESVRYRGLGDTIYEATSQKTDRAGRNNLWCGSVVRGASRDKSTAAGEGRGSEIKSSGAAPCEE